MPRIKMTLSRTRIQRSLLICETVAVILARSVTVDGEAAYVTTTE
jgi:hypothetical protein